MPSWPDCHPGLVQSLCHHPGGEAHPAWACRLAAPQRQEPGGQVVQALPGDLSRSVPVTTIYRHLSPRRPDGGVPGLSVWTALLAQAIESHLQVPSAPPPRVIPMRGRRRQADTSTHICPHPDCSYQGWVGFGCGDTGELKQSGRRCCTPPTCCRRGLPITTGARGAHGDWLPWWSAPVPRCPAGALCWQREAGPSPAGRAGGGRIPVPPPDSRGHRSVPSGAP